MTENSKTTLLLILSGLLIVMGLILFWMWGYTTANQKAVEKISAAQTQKKLNEKTIAASLSVAPDSAYIIRLNGLDKTIDSIAKNSDTLKTGIWQNINEFYSLRQEINTLLQKQPNNANISAATKKIEELQSRLKQLSSTNTEILNENRRLNLLLNQLKNLQAKNNANSEETEQENNTVNLQPSNIQTERDPVQTTAPGVISQSNFSSVFSASDLQLTAFQVNNGKTEETDKAGNTSKIVGSFNFKNNSSQSNTTEVIVVVTQPNGKILQKSSWESGSFQTKDGKRMIYTCKLRNDYEAWETKRLLFTLVGENYVSGRYSMRVYQNGVMLANYVKQLG